MNTLGYAVILETEYYHTPTRRELVSLWDDADDAAAAARWPTPDYDEDKGMHRVVGDRSCPQRHRVHPIVYADDRFPGAAQGLNEDLIFGVPRHIVNQCDGIATGYFVGLGAAIQHKEPHA